MTQEGLAPMCFQPNAPCLDPQTERPPITVFARMLEKTLDDLPVESSWWPELNELHANITKALDKET
jgi:hypothetical protein